MFIRSRTRTGRRGEVTTYFQAIESYRDEGGRPRHRVLAAWNSWSDGTTVADAIPVCEQAIAEAQAEARKWRGVLASRTGDYVPYLGRHRSMIERDAVKAERRLVREQARLLALRRVAGEETRN